MRSLIFCTTCKWSQTEKVGPDGVTGGEALARTMEALLADAGRTDVRVERQACLWSCLHHCNVWIRDDRRFSYITGGFEPKREAAEAILEWFDMHGATETGEVPFRTWPQGMRGHFIARLPPARGEP